VADRTTIQERNTVLTENGFTADSPLVNAVRPAYGYAPGDSSRHFNQDSIDVKAGVVHSVECRLGDMMSGPDGSDSGLLGDDWMDQQSTEASVHYGTDPDHTVQGVKEKDGCWGAGPNANAIGIHCEQTGQAAMSRDEWTTPDAMKQLRRTAALFADVFTRHGIPFQWATDLQIQSAAAGGPACGLTYHEDWTRNFPGDTTHTDPGAGFPGKPIGPYVPGQTDLSGDLLLPLMKQYAAGTSGSTPVTPTIPLTPDAPAPVLVFPPPPPKEWSDMASKEDIQAAIAAALKTDTHTNASGWNVFAPNGRGIGASVNGSRVWSGLTPQSWQALQKACAAAGQTYLNWGSLPSDQVLRLFGKQV